jgi:type IV secretion system protein VirB8
MTSRDTYYAAAKSWADSQADAVTRQTRFAWIVAGVASGIALLLALTVMMLVPLKSSVPYVLTVDRQTGAIEMATSLTDGKLTQNEAVIQAQLAAYVVARETFDATDLAAKYREVQLASSPGVAATYVAQMQASNPQSPLRTLSPGETIQITVRSVSLMTPGTALVRFVAARRLPDGRAGPERSYVSAISYGFSGKPLRAEDRFVNPLGFQVTRYRRDLEGAGT